MPTRVSVKTIAAGLTVPERILLFCLASDTDWQAASITNATAQQMMVRGMIERATGATSYKLTEQGRAVLGALLKDDPKVRFRAKWTFNGRSELYRI